MQLWCVFIVKSEVLRVAEIPQKSRNLGYKAENAMLKIRPEMNRKKLNYGKLTKQTEQYQNKIAGKFTIFAQLAHENLQMSLNIAYFTQEYLALSLPTMWWSPS